MKISYDKPTDSLYIHLADRASVDSDEAKDGVVLDYDTNGALVGIDVQHASQRADINHLSLSNLPLEQLQAAWTPRELQLMEGKAMKSIYFENDDILEIRVSDKPIVREVSQDWHTNISYADDGTIVEIMLLDAKKEGLMPMAFRKAA